MDIQNALEKAEEQTVYSYRLRKRAKQNIEELNKIFDNWEKVEAKFTREGKGKILRDDKEKMIRAVLKTMWYRHRAKLLTDLMVEELQELKERKESVRLDYDKDLIGKLIEECEARLENSME